MKKNTLYLIISVATVLFGSCSQDEMSSSSGQGDASGYARFVVQPFEMGPAGVEGGCNGQDADHMVSAARCNLSYNLSDKKIQAYWDKENEIGIFPIQTQNSQIKYKFEAEDNTDVTDAIAFTGAGWALQEGNTYAAYYPYRDIMGSASYTNVPMHFVGQKQVGNNNLAEIGREYDYMYSKTTVPENGVAEFTFNQAIGLFKFKLRPHAIGQWTRLVITNVKGDNVFVDSASMNVNTGDITALHDTCRLDLELENISTTGTTDDDAVTLYVATLPMEKSGYLQIELRGTAGSFINTIADGALAAGNYRPVTMDVSRSIHTYTDLGLPSGNMWAMNNLGASLPYEHGNYYAWGSLEPTETYYWNTYRLSYNRTNVSGRELTGSTMGDIYRYTFDDGFTSGAWYDENGNFRGDGKKQLELSPATPWQDGETSDDAAQYNWGNLTLTYFGETTPRAWQIPTSADFQELLDNCTFTWTENYEKSGVNGYLVTGTNGNKIFLPAAGWAGSESARDESTYKSWVDDQGFLRQENGTDFNNSGYYWTNELSDSYSFDAKELKFTSVKDARGDRKYYKPIISFSKRYLGASIRPVMHRR